METSTITSKISFKITKKQALISAIFVTVITMFIEFYFGYKLKSIMLRSDALHMLSHALALGISLFAIIYSAKFNRTKSKRIEAKSAVINALLIFMFAGLIVFDAVYKLIEYTPVNTGNLIAIAFLGLVINLITAFLLSLGGIEDLNTKGAFLHLLADTFSSLAIIIGAFLIEWYNIFWIDPILSIIIAIVICKWGIGLLKEACKVLVG